MCGIAGILSNKGQDLRVNLQAMNNSLVHRGPDGEGIWISDNKQLHFAHRRLAIIDLSEQALQPLRSSDGRFVLIFNGEIYNYIELRKICEQHGSRFATHSDSEVIIECYRHFGKEALALLNGMWAFALYDLQQNQVILARDPFGIKPLYYAVINQAFYFASEIKALRAAHPSLSETDDVSIKLFIDHGYVDRDEWTFFKRIKRFPHAHYIIISLDDSSFSLHFHRYWQPPQQLTKISYKNAVAELKSLLHQSIEVHLRSDVAVAACLSGGLDSSAIVCISAKNSDSLKNVFTTHYPEHPEIDETKWANLVREHVNYQHHFATPCFQQFNQEFTKLIRVQDEPFGSLSVFAQYTLFKKIKEMKFKVALSGQGADEQFAGYHSLLLIYLKSLLAAGNLLRFMRERYYLKKNYQLKLDNRNVFSVNVLKNYLAKKLKYKQVLIGKQDLDEYQYRLSRLVMPVVNFDQTLRMMTCETNLPQLLRYEDRNSMSQSVESRVPFLDKNLVDFCLSLPASMKIHKGMTKAVLREALKDIVPDQVRLRMDKLGFPVPEIEWLKKAYNIDVATNGSQRFRELIVDKWMTDVVNAKGNYLAQD